MNITFFWNKNKLCYSISCRPTFYAIYKKKSSEGYQSIPYVVALLSALLLLYYGFLKTNAILIITINCIGCVIEVAYLIMYIIYAPRKLKVRNTIITTSLFLSNFLLSTFIIRKKKSNYIRK